MQNKEIFGQRVKRARIMRGLSMEKLSLAMGKAISRMSISKYERGEVYPTSSNLLLLAEALQLPVDYFFREPNYLVEAIKFRKRSTLGETKSKMIKERVIDVVERYCEIEDICADFRPFKSLPQNLISDKTEALKAAGQLRKRWDLGLDGIVSVSELLEENGIKVVEIEEHPKFDGLSLIVYEHLPVIVLNTSFSSERRRFTAFHELAHLLLKFSPSLSEKECEALCNTFANEMLLPGDVFKSLVGQRRSKITIPELLAIQRQFGISVDALMYKAKEMGIISERSYRQHCIDKNRDKELKEVVEQSHWEEESASRFERLVYRALSDSLISFSKAASLLNSPIEEIKRLL